MALPVAIAELVAQHGKAAVLAAVEELGRRRVVSAEATRAQLEKISGIVDRLGGRHTEICKSFIFPFLAAQRKAEIPVAVTIEVLGRVVAIAPKNPWAFVKVIMAKDYPGYRWGGR